MDSVGREVFWADGVPRPLMPYSQAVKAAGWVFVAGQLATDFATGVPEEVRVDPESPYFVDPLRNQSNFLLNNMAATLKAAGCDIHRDVLRIYQWFTSPRPTPEEFLDGNTWPEISITPYLQTRNEYIDEPRPASTGMGVRELLVKDTIIEVDMIALDPSLGETVGYPAPEHLPSPLAGYSPAVRRGDWVFLAGEIPVDWVGDFGSDRSWGEPSGLAREARTNPYFWYDSPIERQTDYTLQKLASIAEAAGTSLDRCVKATVYIGHPQDWVGMDRVWRKWFPENPPARVIIPYMGLGGMGSRVEIALKLLAGDSELKIETIETSDAPEPVGHEPQAVKAGNLLFFSTQLPIDSTGNLPAAVQRRAAFPYYGQPAKLQMRYMLDNVEAICEAAGTSLANICRRQAFHADLEDFASSIEEWAAHFPKDPPASTTVKVGGPLIVPGAHILLDLIGYVPD